jgi:hypothetical protein
VEGSPSACRHRDRVTVPDHIRYSAIADRFSRPRAMADRGGQRASHREPGTMSGYGVPVGLGERAGGEQCPQCGERTCGRKGMARSGPAPGVTSLCRAVKAASSPCGARPTWDGERRRRTRGGRAQGRPVAAGGCHLGPRIVTSLVARVSQLASEAEAPLDTGRTSAYPGGRLPDGGEPTGEPTVTDAERRQATSSQYRCSSTACQATPSAFSRRSKCAFWTAGRGSAPARCTASAGY